MVSDPVALRYILADKGDFGKSPEHQVIHSRVFGNGSVLYAHGERLQLAFSSYDLLIHPFVGTDHRRIRNIMLPAFSVNALRFMVPKLQAVAEEVW